jgi:transglutaminase-like putative cysteine protease
MFLWGVSTAVAGNPGTDTAITVEKDLRTYFINEDGSFLADHEIVALINEERGIRGYSQRSLSYNKTLESLEIVEAFTQKPDGRKVPVKPDQIKEQQERESSDAPMFQDTLVKVVIFAEVAIGDRLVLQYKTRRSTALFPRHFESLSHPPFHPIGQFTLVYNLPKSMPLHADARGFKATEPVVAAGRKIYRWDNVPEKKERFESGSVSYQDYGQYLAVSTFPDFAAFAQAYDARAKTHVTPQIRELAETVTTGLVSPRDKAIALNDWVRKNIRYVAVYVGPGGVVPHSVETILANRYGDCKDHVAILEALLAAVGIESTPALLNAQNAYTLPKVPTLGVFNHVMTYIPSLDLFLDSTAQSVAGGYLPLSSLDKPVLFSKSGEMGRTPVSQESKTETTTVFKVKSSGDADFSQTSKITGWAAELNRYVIDSLRAADRDPLVTRILASSGKTNSNTFQPIQENPMRWLSIDPSISNTPARYARPRITWTCDPQWV